MEAYAGLFASAFLSATLLPAQSEAVFAALHLNGFGLLPLIAVASVANSLGATANWWLGGRIDRYRGRGLFPVREAALSKASGWYRRYGRWSLLASWVPLIGDPPTVALDLLREPFWRFLAIVALAKTGCYLALAGVLASQ